MLSEAVDAVAMGNIASMLVGMVELGGRGDGKAETGVLQLTPQSGSISCFPPDGAEMFWVCAKFLSSFLLATSSRFASFSTTVLMYLPFCLCGFDVH